MEILPRAASGAPSRIVVVGTLNHLDSAAALCRAAGMEAWTVPIDTYPGAARWLLSRDFWRADAVFQCGTGGVKYILAARLFGKPLIRHWIGTDAWTFLADRSPLRRLRCWLARRGPALHLFVTDEMARGLAEVGIEGTVVRYVTRAMHAASEPLPKEFSVLTYWLPGRRSFYGGDVVLALARELPEVRFRVLGVTDPEDAEPPPNVELLGFVDDIEAVVRRASVLIRMPQTDGAPNLPIEMLARGRYVIYNKPLPGCHLARDLDEARRALAEIRTLRAANDTGARFVREECTLEHQAATLAKAIDRWCSAR
ncbi:MAG: hypothetical protein OZ948_14530 [Deltaproteobacteria bacterium]|nr:hypothetical protein [Deltaproteobacteria bacterium]